MQGQVALGGWLCEDMVKGRGGGEGGRSIGACTRRKNSSHTSDVLGCLTDVEAVFVACLWCWRQLQL